MGCGIVQIAAPPDANADRAPHSPDHRRERDKPPLRCERRPDASGERTEVHDRRDAPGCEDDLVASPSTLTPLSRRKRYSRIAATAKKNARPPSTTPRPATVCAAIPYAAVTSCTAIATANSGYVPAGSRMPLVSRRLAASARSQRCPRFVGIRPSVLSVLGGSAVSKLASRRDGSAQRRFSAGREADVDPPGARSSSGCHHRHTIRKDITMRYSLLLHYPEMSADDLGPEALAEGMRAFDDYAKALDAAGRAGQRRSAAAGHPRPPRSRSPPVSWSCRTAPSPTRPRSSAAWS